MTDASAPQNPQPQGTPPQAPAMRVLGQYIKDLSFENPGVGPVQAQPNIDLGIDVGATPHADGNGLYEVSLKLSAKATAEQAVLFICELARRIIAEITREGGFPPLLIDPVDFVQLYQSQYQRAAAEGDQTPPAAPTGQA